jgi:large subunit ribosomal protein L17
MRHGNKINHLSRTHAHREAMLSNMATSLIMHKRITTTLAKAKELRKFVEPLITKSKTDSTHSRRIVFKHLQNKEAVTVLFRDVAEKVAERPGGYTRILKTGNRLGDNAEMCFIELVDYNENMLKETQTKKTKTRRRGGKKAKSAESASAESSAKTTKAENKKQEKPVEDTETAIPTDSENEKNSENQEESKG